MMKISFRNSEDTPSLSIVRLDHLVLTVRDIGKTLSFYEKILGMKPALVRRRPALPFLREPEDQSAPAGGGVRTQSRQFHSGVVGPLLHSGNFAREGGVPPENLPGHSCFGSCEKDRGSRGYDLDLHKGSRRQSDRTLVL